MKTNSDIIKFAIVAVILVMGFMYVQSVKSDIKYADFDCPRCGSCEVLDLGEDINGNHHYECADCRTKMYDEYYLAEDYAD